MKILFVGYKHDYTNTWEVTKRNFGNDYHLWYLTLLKVTKGMNHEIQAFWVDEMILAKGRGGMNEGLREEIFSQGPDVVLICDGYWDFDMKILAEIKKNSPAVTVYVCGDDSWRCDSISKFYAPYYSWVLTWCSTAVEKYHKVGCNNVILSQPWVDIDIYKPLGTEKDIDVSFVGTIGAPREKVVNALREAGINIVVRGNGWPEGSVSQDEMIEIISRSKIGLSLNPPAFYFSWRSITRLFFRRAALGEPGPSIKFDAHHIARNFREWMQKRIRNVKARTFEIPACGTLEMTQDADNLQNYYTNGKEIILYEDTTDLIKKIRYYLDHHAERDTIARAGYERTIREDSPEVRFKELFSAIGRPL